MNWPTAFAIVGGSMALAIVILGGLWVSTREGQSQSSHRRPVSQDLPYTYTYKGPAEHAPLWMTSSTLADPEAIKKIVREEIKRREAVK